jgi:hypothetical protein
MLVAPLIILSFTPEPALAAVLAQALEVKHKILLVVDCGVIDAVKAVSTKVEVPLLVTVVVVALTT